MTTLLPLFVRTFVIGVAVAAPVGAMGMLCIQRTLERGRSSGFATGLGIAMADGTYASVAAFGVAAVSATLVSWQLPVRLAGGALLIVLGVRSLRAQRVVPPARTQADERRSLLALWASAYGLTLTNPMTIMAFGAVFASAGLAAQPGVASAAIATVGVALGSLAWWVVLVSAVSVARAAASERLVAVAGRVSGIVVVAFGVIAIASALVPRIPP